MKSVSKVNAGWGARERERESRCVSAATVAAATVRVQLQKISKCLADKTEWRRDRETDSWQAASGERTWDELTAAVRVMYKDETLISLRRTAEKHATKTNSTKELGR